MRRLVVVASIVTLLAVAMPAAKAETNGMHPVSFTEQSAIQQVLTVLGGANVRQADRTSTQTMKEFDAWRDKLEASLQPEKAPQQNGNTRKLPPARSRRAY